MGREEDGGGGGGRAALAQPHGGPDAPVGGSPTGKAAALCGSWERYLHQWCVSSRMAESR